MAQYSHVGTGTTLRQPSHSYPVVAEVQYELAEGNGRGWTISMSGVSVLFDSDRPLPVSHDVNLRIDWPFTLNGQVGLRLCISGRIVASHGNRVDVAIVSYEFRYSRRGAITLPFSTSI